MINETLVAAAQYMDEHGKATGEYRDERGHVCMIGALRMVTYGTDTIGSPHFNNEYLTALDKLSEYAKLFTEHGDITEVNDLIHKTKEETVKFLMEAAEWGGK